MTPNEEIDEFNNIFVQSTGTACELLLDAGTSSGTCLADLMRNRLILFQVSPLSSTYGNVFSRQP
jgi:hypothetical protein